MNFWKLSYMARQLEQFWASQQLQIICHRICKLLNSSPKITSISGIPEIRRELETSFCRAGWSIMVGKLSDTVSPKIRTRKIQTHQGACKLCNCMTNAFLGHGKQLPHTSNKLEVDCFCRRRGGRENPSTGRETNRNPPQTHKYGVPSSRVRGQAICFEDFLKPKRMRKDW